MKDAVPNTDTPLDQKVYNIIRAHVKGHLTKRQSDKLIDTRVEEKARIQAAADHEGLLACRELLNVKEGDNLFDAIKRLLAAAQNVVTDGISQPAVPNIDTPTLFGNWRQRMDEYEKFQTICRDNNNLYDSNRYEGIATATRWCIEDLDKAIGAKTHTEESKQAECESPRQLPKSETVAVGPCPREEEKFCWCDMCGFNAKTACAGGEHRCPDCDAADGFSFLNFGKKLPQHIAADDPMSEWHVPPQPVVNDSPKDKTIPADTQGKKHRWQIAVNDGTGTWAYEIEGWDNESAEGVARSVASHLHGTLLMPAVESRISSTTGEAGDKKEDL